MPMAVFSLLLATAVLPTPQVATPTLDHGAPFLGHVLELELAGGTPGQPVRLLESAAADQVVLPVGTLELDRGQLVLAATGKVADDRTARFELALSADPASAELEQHYQALVGDPTAPAGAVLSEAVHLRALGPRAYVGCRGHAEPAGSFRAGLWVVSAIHEAVVLDIDVGAPRGDGLVEGEPNIVFTPDFSRGAWMASPFELILFDPFFGGIVARVPFQEASPTLLTDPGGTRLAVLETGLSGGPARVHLLDFESGAALAVIDLPGLAPGHWAGDGEGGAYVAELDAAGHTLVRRVGLDDAVVHEAVAVGNARSSRFTALASGSGQLFVGTDSILSAYPDGTGEFSRLDLGQSLAAVHVTGLGHVRGPHGFTPVPGAGVLLFPISAPFFPWQGLQSTRLAGPSKVVGIATPTNYIGVGDMVARDAGVWALAAHMDGDGQEQLYRMPSAAKGEWTLVGPLAVPYFKGAGDIDSLRDGFADRIVYTIDHWGPPDQGLPPVLVLLDPDSHAETKLPIGHRPLALRVIPVP